MATFYGVEGLTPEDQTFRGSRFSEVRDALLANPYQQVWGAPGEPPLPVHKATLGGVLKGLLPFFGPYLFRQAAVRTVSTKSDLRWGPDRKGYRRLLHPNGVCLFGQWEITEPTPYSGYFSQGSKALIVARYSTCCSEPRRGYGRSLSMVARIYPTTDPNHAEPLPTAGLITQQDIAGDYSTHINDAELRNAPNVTAFRRRGGLPILLITGLLFNRVNTESSVRQLYEIAELGKSPGEKTRSPLYIRLLVAADQPRIPGEKLDFRDEVMGQIYDPGDPAPKRKLVFDIEVTDQAKFGGFTDAFRRVTFEGWKRIGRITFDSAALSYNGDFVLHFHHPRWREDVNDPASELALG
jgi:hypothetical protein